ncbi:MAG: IMP dehydrogenase [archaeon]
MNNNIKLSLSFDDVLLVPKKSSVNSRKQINTCAQLTKNIRMNIPLVSANMDSVTESGMAIAMARAGGIGIIHRFLSIEDQVAEVVKVKRSESMVVESPYTIPKNKTVLEAKMFMEEYVVGGLLVVDEKGRLEGILSRKDVVFAENNQKVEEVMTKNAKMITINKKVSFDEAKKIMHKHRIEKLPIVDKKGLLQGLITSKDLQKIKEHPQALKDEKGRLMVGAAIGVKPGFMDRAEALVKAEVDVLVLDIAHGHSDLAINVIKKLKQKFKRVDLIAGNVATKEGTRDLIKAGADAIKVGVGPGSICITRIVTGAGVPQLSAIIDCSTEAAKNGIPIIADGGVKNSGDLTKALAAGASAVMCGNIFAGTEESPGVTILRNGMKYKVSRGMASFGAAFGRKEREQESKDMNMDDVVPEGVEAMVPFKGSAKEVINQLIGGLRSGISYCGAKNIKDLHKNAEFVRITSSGIRESKSHDVQTI